MEPHSRASDSDDSTCFLEAQLRDSFGRVTYSHKTHEKCADGLLAIQSWIKIGQIILAAASTAGFVSAISGTGVVGSLIGAGSSAVLLGLNLYTKDIDLAETARKHRKTGSNLWFIREKYLSLITDITSRDISISEIRYQRDRLVDELHEVYRDSPSTTAWAYRRAQKALKWNEEMTFSNEEIDDLLPENLRRRNRFSD